MIKIFSVQNKEKYEIIAVADHQKDLNNLRLMSYRLNDGVDKVQLNKDKYGGPYLKFNCQRFQDQDGIYDVGAIEKHIAELRQLYH